jgi:hypothetical protein
MHLQFFETPQEEFAREIGELIERRNRILEKHSEIMRRDGQLPPLETPGPTRRLYHQD